MRSNHNPRAGVALLSGNYSCEDLNSKIRDVLESVGARADEHIMSEEELTRERALQHEPGVAVDASGAARGEFGVRGMLAWLAVGVPFLIGLFIALRKAAALF